MISTQQLEEIAKRQVQALRGQVKITTDRYVADVGVLTKALMAARQEAATYQRKLEESRKLHHAGQ